MKRVKSFAVNFNNMEHIEAWNLPDAWYQAVKTVLEDGGDYSVGRGSEETPTKKVAASIEVNNPSDRPLVHEKAPTDGSYLNEYLLDYLFSGDKKEGEEYTYGERMRNAQSKDGGSVDQIEEVIKRLTDEPMDRQCTVVLRHPEDIYSDDPPCMTVLDIEVVPGTDEDQTLPNGFPREDEPGQGRELNFYPYFRSWDAYAGFPTNLGGLQLLKEWMADRVSAEDGKLTAFTKNLHLYKRNYDEAEELCEPESTDSFSDRQSD